MDTISRENNSMLPVGGIIVGVVALLIGAWTAVSLSKVKATLAAHEEKLTSLADLPAQVSAASAASDKASKDIAALTGSTQNAVNEIGAEIGNLKASIAKIEESAKAAPAAGGKHHAGGRLWPVPVSTSSPTATAVRRSRGPMAFPSTTSRP